MIRLAPSLAMASAMIVGPGGSLAQQAPPEPLTLPQAVARALEHYPAVAASREAARAAESAERVTAAARWPALSLTASAVRFQEPMPVTPIHGFTPGLAPPFDPTLLQGVAGLRYTVIDGGGVGARMSAAGAESGAARSGLAGTAQAVAAQVAAAYLDVLGSARVLEAQDRRLAALEAERTRVGQLIEVGRAAQVDLLRVEAVLAAASAERVSLASRLVLAEEELAVLTGLPVGATRSASLAPVELRDPALPGRSALLAAALAANPSVLEARSRSEAAAARVAVARSGRWPRLELAAGYNGWASPSDDPVAEWNVGLVASWPVFSGGAVGHEIARAEAVGAAIRELERLAESDVVRGLDRALSSAREARARVESLTTAVARSTEVVRIERLRLDAGTGVQSDYLDAEAVLFANRAALVQGRFGEILARVLLARITGTLDAAWLAQNLGGTP